MNKQLEAHLRALAIEAARSDPMVAVIILNTLGAALSGMLPELYVMVSAFGHEKHAELLKMQVLDRTSP